MKALGASNMKYIREALAALVLFAVFVAFLYIPFPG